MPLLRRLAILGPVVAVIAMPAFGQSVDIPLTNWTVPAYHRSSSGGLTTMSDISPGVAFVAIQPCRVVDTRGGGVFTGAYGPPIMAANAIRSFDIDSAPHCPGIPAGSDAYSLNFTVTQTAGGGDIRAWPTGNPPAQVTSVLNFTAAGVTIANATIIPAGTGGSIDVQVAGSNTHLLIDINGYFTDTYNSGVPFLASGNTGGGMISATNASNANGAAGVKGVQGAAVTGATSEAPAGIVGTSALFNGVLGITQGGSGGAAVRGVRLGVVPPTSGELGTSNLGGLFHNDVEIVDGDLRVTKLDLASRGDIEADGNVTIAGNLQVSGGTKNFVEPHPTDPSKMIQYVSLEGPESGTYFRGRGKFQNGLATIRPPDDFRIVTDPEGLSVQVTPIGDMTTFAVVRIGLDEITVKASRNVEFFYTVNGVRRSHKDFRPISDSNGFFVQRGPTSRIPASFPEELKRRLIANGTYNADGTVNMDTARSLGWDRIWETRQHDEPATAQPNP